MKLLFTLPLLITSFITLAQPGLMMDRIINPCGLPPNDSLDVTGDGIPDLLIGGWSVGTDNEPSSTGSCTRYVGTLPGTTFLCGVDRHAQRVAQAFAHGDTIPLLNTGVQNDLQIPKLLFTEGAITVLEWGYGNAWRLPAMTVGLDEQVFVFQVIANERVVRGTFTMFVENGTRAVRINTGTLVRADEPSIIR